MDLSRLLQICHLWGTACLGQLFTVHGRICSLALVHRQMITAMIAGILASVSLVPAPIHDTTLPPYCESTEQRGRLFVMLAVCNPGDWASTGHGPGDKSSDCQPCVAGDTVLLGRVQHPGHFVQLVPCQ
ncbi:hypothetical protein V8C42DRAFT_329773 [Trichoderma barbatum]